MRFAPLLLLALTVLTAQPALAARESLEKSPMFGRGYCRPAFPCADLSNSDSAREVTQKITQIAESCIARELGLRGSGGYLESSFGLDSALCFTTKKLPENPSGVTMTPKCCVKPIDADGKTCQVICTKYGVR